MNWYLIVETERGLTVATVPEGSSAEDAAVRAGGVVVDPGPYGQYEEAVDAMQSLKDTIDDDRA